VKRELGELVRIPGGLGGETGVAKMARVERGLGEPRRISNQQMRGTQLRNGRMRIGGGGVPGELAGDNTVAVGDLGAHLELGVGRLVGDAVEKRGFVRNQKNRIRVDGRRSDMNDAGRGQHLFASHVQIVIGIICSIRIC
jgi:hypothetical protein